MPYDLDRIRPERAPPPLHINWPVCLLLLVLLMCAGSALLLFRATALLPKQPLPFWSAVLGPPLLLWLIGFSWYVGRKQEQCEEIADTNVQSRRQRQQAIAEASRPLAVLAANYRLGTVPPTQVAKAVAERQLQLLPRLRHADDAQSCQANWLEAPGQAWWPDSGDEAMRQQAVAAWVFAELLASLKPSLLQLASMHSPLAIRLHIASQLASPVLTELWQHAWQQHIGPTDDTTLSIHTDLLPLTVVERWLERPEAHPVTLLLALQLHPLLDQLPLNGQAEAGVAVLLADLAHGKRLKLPAIALLHRPEKRATPQLAHGLRHALCWGRCEPDSIQDQWLTSGAQSPAQQALLSTLSAQGVGASNTAGLSGQHDIDAALGDSGLAAEWLALCLAVEHAGQTGAPQLISTEQAEHITLAVIRPATSRSSLSEATT